MRSLGVKFMRNILSRDLICDYIQFEYKDKAYLVDLIDRWKCLLYLNGAEQGDLVAISIIKVDHNHVASLLACAELGLRVILLDAPATKESIPYTKLGRHGPAKFCISDRYSVNNPKYSDRVYNGLHSEMIMTYCETILYDDQLGDFVPFEIPIVVTPDTPFLVSSTSGTTKPSRPVTFTHEEVCWMSRRCIDIFKFDRASSVVHSRNLHHASSMITSLLPSLMVTEHHCSIPFSHWVSEENRIAGQETTGSAMQFASILHNKFTRIMIPNKKVLKVFLETLDVPFKETLLINMCGFIIDEEFVDLCKTYNVEFISHYGSIDTAIPLLVNHVTKDSIITPSNVGGLPDHTYAVDFVDNRVRVQCHLWKEPRYMDDDLTFVDGKYILQNRLIEIEELLSSCPEPVDLDLFFQDTKINMEQLRGHIETIRQR